MAWDLGDVVPLSVTVTNPAGQAENATAVHLTITLPDGAAETYGPISSTSPGVYDYDYATVQSGLHQVRWVATGTNASAFTDVFDVTPAAGAIVSLADAKDHLNLAGTTADDAELSEMIRAVTAVVERHTGAVVRRTYTEQHRGGLAIAVHHPPVLSVIGITGAEDGVPNVDRAMLRVDAASGVVRRADGAGIRGPVLVTYEAGMVEVPPHARLAGLVILEHLWQTQRGTAVPVFGADEPWDPRQGYAIPRRALELLGAQMPGIA